MVRIDTVVTRGGDKGETSLGDGARLPKHAPRIEALGAVDEANAALGLLMLHLEGSPALAVARIQNDLFDLGADLCRPGTEGKRLTNAALARLESEIAVLNETLPPLTSFILPGGTPAGAHCHMARTLVRRAERAVAELGSAEPVNPLLLTTLNRLSDYFFVLGRVVNNNGARDVLWVPGQ
jgi:cob(I)alamin adenosyltransferase